MKTLRPALLLLAFASSGLLACGSSTSSSPGGAEGGADGSVAVTGPVTTDSCPVVVKAADCDPNTRPLVFVHGTYSSGQDIEHMIALLGSNGFCQDRMIAIDYDSVALSSGFTGGGVDSPGVDCTGPNTPSGCGMIDRAIDALLAKFPQFKQVDLAGHSQGTFHCGAYLALHPEKVAHYINFSGIPNVGAVQTLSLSSERDLFGSPHHATGNSICAFHQTEDGGTVAVMPEGGTGTSEGGVDDGGSADGGAPCNVIQYTLNHQDHFAVAASKDSFVQVYKYLTGKDPMYTDIQCGDDPVTVEGVAETFADNTPSQGTLEIWEVGNTAQEAGGPIMMEMGTTPDGGVADPLNPPGHFGPVTLKRNVQYVFSGKDPTGKTLGWQYFTPFKRDNRLMRILSPANENGDNSIYASAIASMSTGKAVTSPSTTVVVARWAQGGFRQDLGASLKVNGIEVLSSENSGLSAAMNMSLQGGVAALFLEDKNKNGKTDLGLTDYTTFIAFTDVFVSAKTPSFVDLTFTAGSEDPQTLEVPLVIENYPSSVGFVGATFQ
jgi:triacylglycerol esterase/lipase EstA (alpha/beta hydrolase family)